MSCSSRTDWILNSVFHFYLYFGTTSNTIIYFSSSLPPTFLVVLLVYCKIPAKCLQASFCGKQACLRLHGL